MLRRTHFPFIFLKFKGDFLLYLPSITEILEPMSKGVHRILVAVPPPNSQENSNKLFVLTQTDVVRYFFENADQIGPLMSLSLQDLDLVNSKRPLVTVEPSTPILQAVEKMRIGGVSAVAVIEPEEPSSELTGNLEGSNGRILATLSASDFRGVDEKLLGNLENMKVRSFTHFHLKFCIPSKFLFYKWISVVIK